MRTITAAAVALLLACSTEKEPLFPDPSGLYRIEADGPVCDGGTLEEVAADYIVCRWDCLYMDGRDVRSVVLTFRQGADGWLRTFAGWDFGTCE